MLLLFNGVLAQQLGLGALLNDSDTTAQWLGGKQVPPGANPLAQAYAGHQFGHFTMLGDGRAILLGEHISPSGQMLDIQLKGSGRTPYSRQGDGRATLSAMLREYLISEAMYGLGIPTSRSLAVVLTGDGVRREHIQHGAVLTRVAASHLRVGTFEYARRFTPITVLEKLLQYAIERHYPSMATHENPALGFLEAVMERQVALITDWMRVGFIHGVMNTDNMTISGETIDYGPCAFMNTYHPRTVFSSIDTQGRYAFGNQPPIAQWNIARLAEALLPLIHPNAEEAIKLAQTLIERFPSRYDQQWLAMMGKKLGFAAPTPEDRTLMVDLLALMQTQQMDYTNTFLYLQTGQSPDKQTEEACQTPDFQAWQTRWVQQIGGEEQKKTAQNLMQAYNPAYIPRNHLVEQALLSATEEQDLKPFQTLVQLVSKPYEEQKGMEIYQTPPPQGDQDYRTFCGT
jgi:uncharacterized protein YdiU (UPF0061 family)